MRNYGRAICDRPASLRAQIADNHYIIFIREKIG